MRRLEFIRLVGGSAAAWPLTALAQQSATPVIGFLSSSSWDNDDARRLPPFRQGLNEAGYVEGRNVAIEYHGAESQLDRLPALAAGWFAVAYHSLLPAVARPPHWRRNPRLQQFQLFS
jgi:putative ABC transport system substrate-binding protein